MLLRGVSVSYRSSGWSLYPRVSSNDLCTYDPVVSATEISLGDIVFCQIPELMRFQAHIVWEITEDDSTGVVWFLIGNINKRMNGWCNMSQVYGKLVDAVAAPALR